MDMDFTGLRMLRCLFSISLFLSALLLFSIQPMVAKSLLPAYGGTPAVWTVCMLFFQLVLLVSYGYAWLLSLIHKPWLWRITHLLLALCSLVTLPLIFKPLLSDNIPEWAILWNLLTQIGLPVLIIGASAPLLQFAYSQTRAAGAADPYFLYIASNLGSLLSLLLYPWLIERCIGLNYQYKIWNSLYILYLLLLTLVLFAAPFKSLHKISQRSKQLPWSAIAMWVFLSFIPCSLMLGVTLYISTDIAATPLLWIVPLALYLLSFVFTFTSTPWIASQWLARNVLFIMVFSLLGFIIGVNQIIAWQLIVANVLSFFAVALLCHGQLFQRRPQPQQLTLFYFCIAIGGVLAGLFNGILAPRLFTQIYEYPLAISLSVLVFPIPTLPKSWLPPLVILILTAMYCLMPKTILGVSSVLIIGILILTVVVVWQRSKASLFISMLLLFIFIYSPALFDPNILVQERNFYGVKQVINKKGAHVLISQSTVHGLQLIGEKKPLNGFRSYYGAIQPVVRALQHETTSLSVLMIGLGTGTIACQLRQTDDLHIVEIDKQMIDIAANPQWFTYLRDCLPHITIKQKDGRMALAAVAHGSHHMLILDAFNSDAIPVHLLTVEAFNIYKATIKENGVILVNLSNRHLQLLPVLNAIGHTLDMLVLHVVHKGDSGLGQFDSEWALLTANQPLAFAVMRGTGWRFVADGKQLLWTDDYSNIVPLLR